MRVIHFDSEKKDCVFVRGNCLVGVPVVTSVDTILVLNQVGELDQSLLLFVSTMAPFTRASKRQLSGPVPLCRQSAIAKVAFTKEGKKQARKCLMEVSVPWWYCFQGSGDDVTHFLFSYEDGRTFQKYEEIPQFEYDFS